MTYRDAFVGRIKKPGFDWNDESLKLKQHEIEFLTKSFLNADSFNAVDDLIKSGKVPCRKLDWGSRAIPASRAEILEYMKPWEIRADIKNIVEKLSPDISYVLVIEEF